MSPSTLRLLLAVVSSYASPVTTDSGGTPAAARITGNELEDAIGMSAHVQELRLWTSQDVDGVHDQSTQQRILLPHRRLHFYSWTFGRPDKFRCWI
jgi:hypothetical protein